MSAPTLIYPSTSSGGTPVGGSGTTNTIPRWTGTSTLGDSVITQSGSNIGIGTASPVTTLHVARNGTTDPAIIGSGTNSAVGNFESSDFGRANRWTFGRDNSLTGNFVLAYNGSPLMNTTSAGNVGIGTATPDSKLHVAGGASNTAFRVGYAGTSVNYLDGDANHFRDGSGNPTASIRALTFKYLDVSVGGAGWGIKLPATPGNGDRQTIDAYAEWDKGVTSYDWTPSLTGFGGTTPLVVSAKLTRVGRQVTAQIMLQANGAAYSGTQGSTSCSLPAGFTPSIGAAGTMINSSLSNLGACAVWTNGLFYWPTFALTSADTVVSVTYTV